MGNSTDHKPASKWLSVPIISTITRLLYRELTPSEFFHGVIDDVRIYNFTLSAEKIVALFGNK